MPRACSFLLCLSLALAAPATVYADAVARVLSVTPGVRYSLGNAGEALAVKMDVPIKAVVASDATGKAQLIFPDDSTLSIAPDTQISLAEYVDAEQEENIVLDLVSGTARIITGESNRKNPQAFTVNTPQASIGIRGTLVTIQAGGDVTRVYLSETSGKGVSVRNLNTGQVLELRKPGTIINVGANFMEERKATREEAGAFSTALRGRSRRAIQAATARAEMRRAAGANLSPEGTLPPAGLADPVQVAALATDDRLTEATLVAEATPAVPSVPPAPTVSVLPAAPALPELPVDDIFMTGLGSIVGAEFSTTEMSAPPTFDFYLNDVKVRTNDGDMKVGIGSEYTKNDNIYTSDLGYISLPHYAWNSIRGEYAQAPSIANSAHWTIKTNGQFTLEYSGFGMMLNGKFISPTLIQVQSAQLSSQGLDSNGDVERYKTVLIAPIEIPRSN